MPRTPSSDRSTGGRKLGDLSGRLGRSGYPDLDSGIWIHAVSVGEVNVARNLLVELASAAPGRRLGLSVTTEAGRKLAESTLPREVPVFAFPVRSRRPRPEGPGRRAPGTRAADGDGALAPLSRSGTARAGSPSPLVNGRLSDRSFPRYRLARRFLRGSLDAISLFAMRSREDALRLEALDAPPSRIRVCGNIKYDLPAAPPFADAARLARIAGGRPVFVAASTAEGEEQIVLEAFRSVAGRALLAVAPRRPERFDAVASTIEKAGFSVVRRSSSDNHPITRSPDHPIPQHSVYLLDSIGELASLYREASLAFVGGSFAPVGGHNPIEAWAQGVPVIVGPHTENFREVYSEGEARGF